MCASVAVADHRAQQKYPIALNGGHCLSPGPAWILQINLRRSNGPGGSRVISRVTLEAGWPKGALNMIHGGREINTYILEQPEIQGLGFIGSTKAGWDLFKLCGQLGKNSSINGNGKNTVVIMPDADPKTIVPYVRQGCFGMTGQRCLGSDNVVVIGDLYDEFKQRFADEERNMKLGYGWINRPTWVHTARHWVEIKSRHGWNVVWRKERQWCTTAEFLGRSCPKVSSWARLSSRKRQP